MYCSAMVVMSEVDNSIAKNGTILSTNRWHIK